MVIHQTTFNLYVAIDVGSNTIAQTSPCQKGRFQIRSRFCLCLTRRVKLGNTF